MEVESQELTLTFLSSLYLVLRHASITKGFGEANVILSVKYFEDRRMVVEAPGDDQGSF